MRRAGTAEKLDFISQIRRLASNSYGRSDITSNAYLKILHQLIDQYDYYFKLWKKGIV